jgi:hypothetical protein
MSIPRITEILEENVGIDGENFEADQSVKKTELECLEMILLELQKLNLSMQIAFNVEVKNSDVESMDKG